MRLFLWIIGGILLGGIIHLISILQLPNYSENRLWQQIVDAGPANRFNKVSALSGTTTPTITGLDPAFLHALCRYSLAGGPMRIQGQFAGNAWWLSLYTKTGESYYTISAKTAQSKAIDLYIGLDQQFAELSALEDLNTERSLILKAPVQEGFALVHVFLPNPHYRTRAENMLREARCAPLT